MHIKELVSLVDIEEARKNNWGREKSTAAGQALGQQYAQGLPTADRDAEIQKIKAQPTTGGINPALQTRLAGFKAGKKAASPAPQGTSQAAANQQAPAADQQGQQQAANTNQQDDAGTQQPSGWEKFKQGAKQFGQSVAKNAPGLAKGAANLATGVVGAAGNLAAQTAGGVAQTLGAARGGYLRGRESGKQGKLFRTGDNGEPAWTQTAAPAAQASDSSAVSDELASLRDVINRMNRRLSNIEQGAGRGPQQNLRVAEQRKRLRVAR